MTAESVAAPAPPGLLAEIGRFARLSILGFTLLVTLAGAATVAPVSMSQLVVLIAVGIAFHVFAYVSNDVFDLDLDRDEPLRAGSPLVRGLVRPSTALLIALVPVPLACVLHLLAGGAPTAAAALLIAMALMLIYNRYGKRIAFALVSDAVQGLGWVALALYGALSMRAPMTPAAGWLAAIVFAYVLLVNGLHGGLRDLANDARHGARTTAILFGARADEEGRVLVPRALRWYGFALQLLLMLLGIASVRRWPLAAVVIVAAYVVLFLLGRAALRPGRARRDVVRAGFAHLFLSLGVVFVPFALFANATAGIAIIAVYALPLLVLCIRMTRRRVLLALLLAAASLSAEPVVVVSREQLVEAMRAEQQKGYAVTATANGARFNSGVILTLAHAAFAADPNGAPLLIDHREFFAAFLAVTGLPAEQAPVYIRIARQFGEDQLVDYRRGKVLAKEDPRARFAVNVITGWSGGAPRYSYEDHQSTPALRVTHERFTSYRLVELDGMQLIDDVHGVSGRALGGLLGLVFRFVGDADAVRSFSAVQDNAMITLTTARKGFTLPSVPAIVYADGTADRRIPAKYTATERRLQAMRFEPKYAAIEKKSPAERRK